MYMHLHLDLSCREFEAAKISSVAHTVNIESRQPVLILRKSRCWLTQSMAAVINKKKLLYSHYYSFSHRASSQFSYVLSFHFLFTVWYVVFTVFIIILSMSIQPCG